MGASDTDGAYAGIPDEELMRLTAAGDRLSFAELVHRHQNSLLNFFRRLGVYREEEDLVQEVFIRLYHCRERYQPTAKFTTFLYVMARHIWVDFVRKNSRREELQKGLGEERVIAEAGGARADHHRVSVEEAMEHLPESMRVVVTLSVFQGLKYEEIAEVLEIPVGTVKSRMFHALKKMREDFHVES